MNDIWKREEIESPCVQICVIDPQSKHCIGCGRTGSEIARWSSITTTERAEITALLPERLQKMSKRPRSHASRRRREK